MLQLVVGHEEIPPLLTLMAKQIHSGDEPSSIIVHDQIELKSDKTSTLD